jgi:N-acetylneuraminate lyase
MSIFRGIFPAIVTPFGSDGKFDENAFSQLTQRLYSAGVHGLYVCGQTGEGMQQSAEQRMRVAEAAVRLSPAGKKVIVHVGAASTSDAVALAKHAANHGAHALSALQPGPAYSFTEIRDYYTDLAAAAEIPLLIYYYPALAPKIESIDQFLELCNIPNVIGLKFTHTDLFTMREIQRRGNCILFGYDEMLVAGLLMGADGGVGSIYNLIPEEFVRLYELSESGKWPEALVVQGRVNELIEVVLRFPLHPGVKLLLKWSGIDCGTCVRPRRDLSNAEVEELQRRLATTEIGRKKWSASIAK